MEGSAKIISSYHQRREPTPRTQNILNKWKDGDDPEIAQIVERNRSGFTLHVQQKINEEKKWVSICSRTDP